MINRVVTLAALVAAPAVQAFTPAQLKGAWFCQSDGYLFWSGDASKDWETIDGSSQSRILYFDYEGYNNNRGKTLLTGSMYVDWTPSQDESGANFGGDKTQINTGDVGKDRHDRFIFKGTITDSTTAELTLQVSDNDKTTVTPIEQFAPRTGPSQDNKANGNPYVPYAPAWRLQTTDQLDNYVMSQVDADHFTLTIPHQDKTGLNCLLAAPTTTTNVCDARCLNTDSTASTTAANTAGCTLTAPGTHTPTVVDGTTAAGIYCPCKVITKVISTEKCVRGLPKSNKSCSFLHQTDTTSENYLSGSEADRECRGNLLCVNNEGGGRNFGECGDIYCCSLPRRTPPPVPAYNPYTYPRQNYYQGASYSQRYTPYGYGAGRYSYYG